MLKVPSVSAHRRSGDAPPAEAGGIHIRALCEVRCLGLVPYSGALALQRRLSEARFEGRIPDTLLLLEHPPVFTLGRRASYDDILAPPERRRELGIEVHEANRGGLVTYHGPG